MEQLFHETYYTHVTGHTWWPEVHC